MNNLKAINISKTYSIDGYEIEVLKNLNLIVKKGDTVAISGQSGSGKSTLLQLLALLDKQSSGSIELNNEVMDDLTSNQKSKIRLNNFGFVYQHHHLLEDLTVYENIALPLKLKGDLQNLDIKVRDLAKSIGLSERLNHLPWKLSGGEKQRVAVARAMINKPEYISYALKFVQSGMIFMKPDNDIPNQPNDYSSQFKILKELNISNDENKLHKVLEIAKGDLQIAIRFLFQDDIDERVEI